MRPTTIGGVNELPTREKAWVMPCANPRSTGRVHLAMAEVAVGKVAPSPNPSNSRAMTMVANPFTKPVKIVASAQIREQTVNTFRGPNRSPK